MTSLIPVIPTFSFLLAAKLTNDHFQNKWLPEQKIQTGFVKQRTFFHEQLEIRHPSPDKSKIWSFEPNSKIITKARNPKIPTIPTMFLPATEEEIEFLEKILLPNMKDFFENNWKFFSGPLSSINRVNKATKQVPAVCFHFPNKFIHHASEELGRKPIRLSGDYIAHGVDFLQYVAPAILSQILKH
jgi:hypothetical protein